MLSDQQKEDIIQPLQQLLTLPASEGGFGLNLPGGTRELVFGMDPIVKAWIEHAPPDIQRKLTRVGLYDLPLNRTAEEMWDTFLQKHDIKTDGTRKTFLEAKKRFFLFFKPNELISRLTKDRLEEWKAFLLAKGYATALVAGFIRKTKTVSIWAKKQK